MIDQPPGTADAAIAEHELAELYVAFAGRLRQIVGGQVGAPDGVIEDACQFAWSRLIDYRTRVRRDTALGWLATTAVREAFKLLRRQRREIPFDALAEDAGLTSPAPAVTS